MKKFSGLSISEKSVWICINSIIMRSATDPENPHHLSTNQMQLKLGPIEILLTRVVWVTAALWFFLGALTDVFRYFCLFLSAVGNLTFILALRHSIGLHLAST